MHEVSNALQAKSGNSLYFTALLQEADKNSRVVVFDVQKHNNFQCAARDRSPMKLSNVGLSPSKQHKNSNDVLVNSRSNVAVLRHLDFAFEERVTSICPVRTLREIVEDVREYQRVTVKVKMLKVLEEKECVVHGQKLRRKTVVVSDANELVLLTLWGQHDMIDRSWYVLENVSVRQFRKMTTLNTTMQTTMKKTTDCGTAREFSETDFKTLVGEILDADVKVERFCPRHHLLENMNKTTLMTRCMQCQAFCKTLKTTVEIRGHITITVKCAQEKILLDDVQMRELLSVINEANVDCHGLAADILGHEKLKLTMWKDFVTDVSFVPCTVTAVGELLCDEAETAGSNLEDDN